VDTGEGQRFVSLIKDAVTSTHSPNVLAGYGGFAGCFDVSFLKNYENPVLVSATDGVGTKLRLASLFHKHDTIGIDLVAMCSNDILVTGAKPLLFLDYIACGKLNADAMKTVVASIAEGCRQAKASLIGGETAEHPGLMNSDDYDLAGFMVGAVEKGEILDGQKVKAGDILIGLPSSGVHSNGLSLVRKIFLKNGIDLPDSSEDQLFLKNEILRPTIIYEPDIRPLFDERIGIHGIVHITGGGFFENIPRILPKHLRAVINKNELRIPELFQKIEKRGNIPEMEMFSVFNMGVGMIIAAAKSDAQKILDILKQTFSENHPDALGEPRTIGKIEDRSETESPVEFQDSSL